MGTFSLLQRGGGGGWRTYFETQLAKLQKELPSGSDSWSPHSPPENVVRVAREIVSHIERDDLPLPLMIPGSDGSLQIKWRRIRELSFFVFPDAAPEFLQVFPDGQIAQGMLTNDQQAPSLINWLLAA